MSSDKIFVRDSSIEPCVIFQRSACMSNCLLSGSNMQNIMSSERVMRRNSPILFDRATYDELTKTENDGQEANKQPANELDINESEVNDAINLKSKTFIA